MQSFQNASQGSKSAMRHPRGGQSALQLAANDSPQVTAMGVLQAMANASIVVQRLRNTASPLQRMDDEDLMQGKAIQRMDDEELMQGKAIQRMDDEELMQGKAIQRMDDEELMQGKAVQRAETQAPRTNDTGLPDNLKSGIESLSGMSMDHVNVHRNSDKPAQVQAHAYAQGSDIHLGLGQEKHLPHEAWHVVQQAQGRVKPTMQMKGVAVNDDAGLETEADVMGAKALQQAAQLKSYHSGTAPSFQASRSGDTVQRKGDRHYWYRPVGGAWTYAGAFKNHSAANKWRDAQNFPQGTGFGQGGKSKYR